MADHHGGDGHGETHEISPLLTNFGKTRVNFDEIEEVIKHTNRKGRDIYTGNHADRFYYKDEETFENLLELYNSEQRKLWENKENEKNITKTDDEDQNIGENGERKFPWIPLISSEVPDIHGPTGPLQFVGKVNCCMRMCIRCGDAGKKMFQKESYYMNREERAQVRTVLCRGCLGAELRSLEVRTQGDKSIDDMAEEE